MKSFLALCIFLLAPQIFAQAPDPPPDIRYSGDVSLAWDPSPSEGVIGYRVYYGTTSGSYDSYRTVAGQTSYTMFDLAPGTYYFAVTAYDSAENESGFSNEVSATVLDNGVVENFLVLGPFPIDTTATSIKLSWKTSQPCTTRIEFTYEGGTFSSLIVDAEVVTDHFVRLTELQAGTLYSYEVYNEDSEGNMVVGTGSFRTK